MVPDIETDVFDAVATTLEAKYGDIFVTGEYVHAPEFSRLSALSKRTTQRTFRRLIRKVHTTLSSCMRSTYTATLKVGAKHRQKRSCRRLTKNVSAGFC